MQGTHPLASESFHLFQHVGPMLRPFPLYHFHCNSWQDIFDVTLLLQDRMSALMRHRTGIGDQTDFNFIPIIQQMFMLLTSLLLLITAAWHTPSAVLSLAVACCSIWTCRNTEISIKYMPLPSCSYWLFLIYDGYVTLTWWRAPGFANRSVSLQLAGLCRLIVSHMGHRRRWSL